MAFTFYCSFTNYLISNQSFQKLLYFLPLLVKSLLRYPLWICFQALLLYFFFWFTLGCYQLFVLCFVFITEKKILPLKSRFEVVNFIPWVQSAVWLWLLYQADLQPRGGRLGRNLRIPRSVTPFFGFMESLGGLLCAKHVLLGKEWGWYERRSFLSTNVCS